VCANPAGIPASKATTLNEIPASGSRGPASRSPAKGPAATIHAGFELRKHRGSLAQATAALRQPETLRTMLQGTVVHLRMGLDYLERRSEWRRNIA
jgi:sugar (pentulose or hexulose) kinase